MPLLSAGVAPPKYAGSTAPSVWRSQLTVPGVAAGATVQSVMGARPSSTTPPHWPCELSVARPSTLSRLVNTIGAVAVPTALMRLPRLTASQATPVEAKTTTPGWIVRVTATSPVTGAAPRSVPTSTRPPIEYRRPGMRVSVVLRVTRAGSSQTRYVPVGPLMVPRSARPAESSIVGQPPAGVTSVGAGGGTTGVGGVAGGLLMVMLPPLPGEATSPAPQPASTALTAARIRALQGVESLSINTPLRRSRLLMPNGAACRKERVPDADEPVGEKIGGLYYSEMTAGLRNVTAPDADAAAGTLLARMRGAGMRGCAGDQLSASSLTLRKSTPSERSLR